MKTSKQKNFIKNALNSHGSTLIEMIVSFAMLSILMAVFFAIVTMITGMYYEIKGETYASQVSDIVIGKISSEIEGAKYSDGADTDIPLFGDDKALFIGDTLSLYDKTDTHITMGTKSLPTSEEYKSLYVDYSTIIYTTPEKVNLSREATTWQFDSNAYNGFGITELKFVRADMLGTVDDNGLFDYDGEKTFYMNHVDNNVYPSNVIAVFLTIKSPKYGEYRTVKFVNMYNFPADWIDSIPSGT